MAISSSTIEKVKMHLVREFGAQSDESRAFNYSTSALVNWTRIMGCHLTGMKTDPNGEVTLSFNTGRSAEKFIFYGSTYMEPGYGSINEGEACARKHDDGWTVSGYPYRHDCLIQMEDFTATHAELGTVSGNFNQMVVASSMDALTSFVNAHAPGLISRYAD